MTERDLMIDGGHATRQEIAAALRNLVITTDAVCAYFNGIREFFGATKKSSAFDDPQLIAPRLSQEIQLTCTVINQTLHNLGGIAVEWTDLETETSSTGKVVHCEAFDPGDRNWLMVIMGADEPINVCFTTDILINSLNE